MAVSVADQQDVHHDEAHIELSYTAKLRQNRMGLWLFCISEVFLFGGIFAARFYLWGNTRPELNQVLGLITTSILLVSSFFMARAEAAISHGDRKSFLRNLALTGVLGIAFLVGVVGFEWNAELAPTDGAFGAIFFGMTGLHALHVLSGVFLIFVVWWRGRKGGFSAEEHWGVEATAIYWHFVDVVWVFFYPALYLIGQPVHVG